MASRVLPLQNELVVISKITQERSFNCIIFLVCEFFVSIFLFILHTPLLFLQLPVMLTFLLMYLKPSYAKQLLLQQRIGQAGAGLCIIKALFLFINMIVYLIHFFNQDSYTDKISSINEQIISSFEEDVYLFYTFTYKRVPGVSYFVGIVLCIVFLIMTTFESVSVYCYYLSIQRTNKIIKKIANIEIPQPEREEREVSQEQIPIDEATTRRAESLNLEFPNEASRRALYRQYSSSRFTIDTLTRA